MLKEKRLDKLCKKNLYCKREKNLGTKKRAIFFDRDGVLIKECHYLSSADKVEIEKGVFKILKFAKSKNWLIIVLTNQSGISRGLFNWDDYENVTKKFLGLINNPDYIDGIYANGYVDANDSSWRKPNPGMILEADEDFNIDLKNSILVGDRITDLQAAVRGGIRNIFHVMTGHGHKEREEILKYCSPRKNRNSLAFRFNDINNSSNLFLLENLEEFPLNVFD